ncbi:hypothetical protein Taro_050504 [Colocasia esculenta]|uniref:LysM domain-containing protein n=1 Tax=Colocasia esculenta TaxID=4460 RepID=A0A843XE71_COLES|nr:hypothetical protein [Colocasia esculenta]
MIHCSAIEVVSVPALRNSEQRKMIPSSLSFLLFSSGSSSLRRESTYEKWKLFSLGVSPAALCSCHAFIRGRWVSLCRLHSSSSLKAKTLSLPANMSRSLCALPMAFSLSCSKYMSTSRQNMAYWKLFMTTTVPLLESSQARSLSRRMLRTHSQLVAHAAEDRLQFKLPISKGKEQGESTYWAKRNIRSTIKPCAGSDTGAALVGYTLYADLKDRILPVGLFLRVPVICACDDRIHKCISIRYRARPDDTLASITCFVYVGLVSTNQIWEANGIMNPKTGRSLTVLLPCSCFNSSNNMLPAVYLSYVWVGDTILGIAAEYSTTVTDIMNVNAMGTPYVMPWT